MPATLATMVQQMQHGIRRLTWSCQSPLRNQQDLCFFAINSDAHDVLISFCTLCSQHPVQIIHAGGQQSLVALGLCRPPKPGCGLKLIKQRCAAGADLVESFKHRRGKDVDESNLVRRIHHTCGGACNCQHGREGDPEPVAVKVIRSTWSIVGAPE